MTNTIENLKTLQKLSTQGKWNNYFNPSVIHSGRQDICDCRCSEKRNHNGRFIVAMQNSLPIMLELIDAIRSNNKIKIDDAIKKLEEPVNVV